MIDTSGFIIRSSGRKADSFYIDYFGHYKVSEISKESKIDAEKLSGIYISNGGILDTALDVFYFNDIGDARKTLDSIFSSMKKKDRGRAIIFTGAEIEYIRSALINESGFAGINNKLKDEIFKKLNG